MCEEIMEESIRKIIRSIIKDPVLKPLMEEELHKYYFSDAYINEGEKEISPLNKQLSTLIVDEDFGIYLKDNDQSRIDIDGYQAKALFIFYLLLAPSGISNGELKNHKRFITELYKEIRKCDYDIARQFVDGMLDREDGINDANFKIRKAFKAVVKDETVLQNYIVYGPKGKKRRLMLPKEFIEIENTVLKNILSAFRRIRMK